MVELADLFHEATDEDRSKNTLGSFYWTKLFFKIGLTPACFNPQIATTGQYLLQALQFFLNLDLIVFFYIAALSDPK